MAITNYKIIKAPLYAIEAQVGAAIGGGWVPFGSPSLVYPQDKEIYQALIKGTPTEGDITDYTVVQAPLDSIETIVATKIADGWEPFGSPAFVTPHDKVAYQALVKVDPSE